MSKGFVYILTNPCLDGWVKIGMTKRNDISERLQELNSPTNIPLSYRCYATYEVENPQEVEKYIHSIIDRIDSSLHARECLDNGRVREREFFKISPETAYGIFRDVAGLRGDIDKLKPYSPTTIQMQEQEFAETRTKRARSSFALLGILPGEELSFLYDSNIVVRVVNNLNRIEYQGEEYTVSALAIKLLIENYGWAPTLHVNGWNYFTKNGTSLSDLRLQLEESFGEE